MLNAAYRDLCRVHWRSHVYGRLPASLTGRQVAGVNLVHLAEEAEVLAMRVLTSEEIGEKPYNHEVAMIGGREAGHTMGEANRLLPLIDAVLLQIDGDEWQYFQGLRSILWPATLPGERD